MDSVLTTLNTELAGVLLHLDEDETQYGLPEKWTIQEIAEHLLLTYRQTSFVLSGRLSKGRATQTRPTLAQHVGRYWVVKLGHFPSGRVAPHFVCPSTGAAPRAGQELAFEVNKQLVHMQDLLNQVSSAFSSQRRSVSHAILGPLTPEEWERFHLAHGRHHMRQIEQITREHQTGC